MKRYLIWFSLLMKRMIKKPAFVLMLIGMLILAISVSKLEQGEKAEASIGIIIIEETNERQNLSEADEEWNKRFLSLLCEQDGILTFQTYESKDILTQDIEKGELDCGFVLPQDLRDKIETDNWQDAITVYSSASSVLTEIAKERIAAAVFTMYSEGSYVNYIKNSPVFKLAQADESGREEIIAFAKNAYETHLLDGSTFDFVYNEGNNKYYNGDSNIGNRSEVLNDNGNANRLEALNDNDNVNQSAGLNAAGTTFRLRGILAVCIFLSGMCGLLTDWKDREEKRFLLIVPAWATTMANIWVATFYTVIVTLTALLLTNQFAGFGDCVKELFRLFIYQFLIVIYCSIIRLVLRKQETIAAAIPILTLACMICCPVWIRLAVYLPVFRILEKLFPATYYLLWVG